jgi:hypothetical protein
MSTVGKPLGDILAAGRTRFNARAAMAAQRYRGFDPAAFAAFLAGPVDAVVGAVASVEADRVAPVAVAVYDIALDLIGQGLAGPTARDAIVDRAWTALASSLARLIAAEPVQALGAITNAVLQLRKFPALRVDDWLSGMVAAAPLADSVSALRGAGQVLAWRAGMAHFREGALGVATSLPHELARVVLDTRAEEPQTTIAAFRADRWWTPDGRREQGVEAGAFTGFGGLFAEPPVPRASGAEFVVRSADRHYLLVADAYGAVLLPAAVGDFAAADAHPQSWKGAADRLPFPVHDLRVAHTVDSTAIGSPLSHAIRILPRA